MMYDESLLHLPDLDTRVMKSSSHIQHLWLVFSTSADLQLVVTFTFFYVYAFGFSSNLSNLHSVHQFKAVNNAFPGNQSHDLGISSTRLYCLIFGNTVMSKWFRSYTEYLNNGQSGEVSDLWWVTTGISNFNKLPWKISIKSTIFNTTGKQLYRAANSHTFSLRLAQLTLFSRHTSILSHAVKNTISKKCNNRLFAKQDW